MLFLPVLTDTSMITSVHPGQCDLSTNALTGTAGPAHTLPWAGGYPLSIGQESPVQGMVNLSLRLQIQLPGQSQHKLSETQLPSGL